MALATRPAGRFFAAFYRLNCSTPHPADCQRIFRRRRSHFASRAGLPSTTTRPLLQGDGVFPFLQQDESPVRETERPGETERFGETDRPGATESVEEDHAAMQPAVRNLMRMTPSAVTVITARGKEEWIEDPVPIGSAVSSMTTVTLTPPCVSFNIKAPSRTLDAIQDDGGLFCAHFLENSAQGARMAHDFAQMNSPSVLSKRVHTIPFQWDNNSPPRITAPCVLASMTCQLVQQTRVSDHVVAIAKVTEFRSRENLAPTLFYHQGKYMQYDGAELLDPSRIWNFSKGKPNASDLLCNYSLFTEGWEKEDFIDHVKAFVKQNEHIFRQPDNYRSLKFIFAKEWGWEAPAFGISFAGIVNKCKVELGYSLDNLQKQLPVSHRFYGTLSSSDVAEIAKRAESLIRRQPVTVEADLTSFLEALDVHPDDSSLLARDVLELPRKANLIPPLELLPVAEGTVNTILDKEQLEYRLSERLSTMPFEKAIRMGIDELMGIQLSLSGKAVIRQTYRRIFTEAYPEVFSDADLRGHLSPEEVRIAIARVLRYIDYPKKEAFRKILYKNSLEIFREISVHPMATGFDMDFFRTKLRYIKNHTSDKQWSETVEAMDKMLDPLLARGPIEVEELQSRIKKLIESHLPHVLRWSMREIVPAMGFRDDVTYQDKEKSVLTIHHVANKFLTKELRARIDNTANTLKETRAILEWLSPQKTELDPQPDLPLRHVTKGFPADRFASRSTEKEQVDDMQPDPINITRHFFPGPRMAFQNSQEGQVDDKPKQLPETEVSNADGRLDSIDEDAVAAEKAKDNAKQGSPNPKPKATPAPEQTPAVGKEQLLKALAGLKTGFSLKWSKPGSQDKRNMDKTTQKASGEEDRKAES